MIIDLFIETTQDQSKLGKPTDAKNKQTNKKMIIIASDGKSHFWTFNQSDER